jgi:hypothetical protein
MVSHRAGRRIGENRGVEDGARVVDADWPDGRKSNGSYKNCFNFSAFVIIAVISTGEPSSPALLPNGGRAGA